MGLGHNAVVVFWWLVAVHAVVSIGEVYKVGDSAGWTNTGEVNYTTWSANKIFHVGDTIVFKYNKQFHNVVRVKHKAYNACNATSPYQTMASGDDSFTIKKPGHFFFICSLPGHCEQGEKVDIRVPAHFTQAPTPAPVPSVTPAPPPSVPSPSPPPSSSPSPSPPSSHSSPSPSPPSSHSSPSPSPSSSPSPLPRPPSPSPAPSPSHDNPNSGFSLHSSKWSLAGKIFFSMMVLAGVVY